MNPLANGRLKLAPAYDLLPTNSGQAVQDFIGGDEGSDSTLANAMSQCAAFGLAPTEAAAEVAAVIAVVNDWRVHFAEVGVTAGDIQRLAERVEGAPLCSQRIGFDPASFHDKPPGRKRASPVGRR